MFKTIWYYSSEDEAYIMFAPDLPGCFADGKTIAEAKKNIAEIMNEWIEDEQELGGSIPEPLLKLDHSNSSLFDAVKYILTQTGEIDAVKLHQLAYYCKVWSLVWFHALLFPQQFEAWEQGAICQELFERLEGKRIVSEQDMQGSDSLTDSEKRFIDDVLSVYEPEAPEWLARLTRSESPWMETRDGFLAGRLPALIITPSLIEKYYAID